MNERHIENECGDLVGNGERLSWDDHIAKVSIVGVGMRSHAGVAKRMFELITGEGINIQMISTSEIKISCVIDEKYAEPVLRSLHDGFGLGESGMQIEVGVSLPNVLSQLEAKIST